MKPTQPLLRAAFVAALAFAMTGVSLTAAPVAHAESAIKAVVNNIAITNGDIAKRVAFLRLRRVGGNLTERAREEIINEILQREEIIRLGVSVSTDDVESSFGRFAENNGMSPQQLNQLLDQAGVGASHFKAYIGVQMSWPRVVNIRYGNSGKMTEQDYVTRLKQSNGQKPTTTEYMLQQVIFVIPESKRGKITGKRKSEAEASRKNYPGCDTAKVFAAQYRDVSVRNLGRFLAPELPSDWKAMIEKTQQGQTTGTRVTEKGVEYISVCKRREVNDDVAAQMVFQANDVEKAEQENENPNSKKYIELLRKKAEIIIK